MKTNHIAEVFLCYVGVPYTARELRHRLRACSHRNSFLGLREVLGEYGIESKGLQTTWGELLTWKDPFMVLLDGSFVVVCTTDSQRVAYLTADFTRTSISAQEFERQWDGSVLLLDVTEKSQEPQYTRNLVAEVLAWCKVPLSAGILLCGIWFLFKANRATIEPFEWTLLVLYLLGFAVSFLLTKQSFGVKTATEKRISKHGLNLSCALLLQSQGAKLFGAIDWGVVGLAYFWGCLHLLLFGWYDALIVVSLLALPYTVWSIWYQGQRAKQWCLLCLCVQGVLWALFLTFWLSGSLQAVALDGRSIVVAAIAFLVPILCLWWVVPMASRSFKLSFARDRLMRLKANPIVFSALLAEQPLLALAPEARLVVLGNHNADTVLTVVSTPYCRHCAELYLAVLRPLLAKRREQIRLELLFVGDPTMGAEIKRLLSVCFRYNEQHAEEVYAEWFATHISVGEPYLLDKKTAELIDSIYWAQNQWTARNPKQGTPTLYVNSKRLPEQYAWADLKYVL